MRQSTALTTAVSLKVTNVIHSLLPSLTIQNSLHPWLASLLVYGIYLVENTEGFSPLSQAATAGFIMDKYC